MVNFLIFLFMIEPQFMDFTKRDIPEYEEKIVVNNQDAGLQNPLKNVLLAAIRIYQNSFSLVQGDVCNFSPSCSHFGYEAIKYHGPIKGLLLTSDRLQRCHSGAWKYLNKFYTLKIDSVRGPKLFDPVERY